MLFQTQKTKMSKPIPVRFPIPLLEKIQKVSEKTNLSVQETIRLSTLKGLQKLDEFLTDQSQRRKEGK